MKTKLQNKRKHGITALELSSFLGLREISFAEFQTYLKLRSSESNQKK